MPQSFQAEEEGRTWIGIALAGGGPLGAIYEIGALMALDEALDGVDLSACDVYVGVSSGAFFAAGLANGLSPRAMHKMFIESEGDDDPFEPKILLRPAFREYARRLGMIPGLIAEALTSYLEGRPKKKIAETLQTLARSFPAGVFDSTPIRDYIEQLVRGKRMTNDFRHLRCKLFIVATDLDTVEPVIFGSPGWDHIPISQAVEASAALPGLFPPVKLEGRYYVDGALQKTLHASAALKEGVKLLIAINPIVPFKASPTIGFEAEESLAEGGLVPVFSQTFRSLIHSRMRTGMERYRHEYPDADVLLFEPSRHDRELFFSNVFSYADRRRLCEHAYQYTREDLRRRLKTLRPALARHGVAINEAVLMDPSRTLLRKGPVTQDLHGTLERLTETLGRLEPMLQEQPG